MRALPLVPAVHAPDLFWLLPIFQTWYVSFLLIFWVQIFWVQICLQWFSHCLKVLSVPHPHYPVAFNQESWIKHCFINFFLIDKGMSGNEHIFVYNSGIIRDHIINDTLWKNEEFNSTLYKKLEKKHSGTHEHYFHTNFRRHSYIRETLPLVFDSLGFLVYHIFQK